MSFTYDYIRSAQIVAYLLNKSGGEQNLLKLVKLLYIAERESLRQRGLSLTADDAWALPNGPVLTRIYNNLRDDPSLPFKTGEEDYWLEHFGRTGNTIKLEVPVGNDRLSESDEAIIDQVFEEYKDLTPSQLADLTHTFPEWQANEAGKSSAPIPFEDILRAIGTDERRIQHLQEMKEEDRFFQRRLAA